MKKLSLVLLVMLLLCGCGSEVEEPVSEEYTVTYDTQHSISLGEMVATGQLAYYRSNRNHICAYDHEGLYQFCISFTATQNGALKMQIVDDLLYVITPRDRLYIFDYDRLVECLSKQDAIDQGYIGRDYYWEEVNVKRSGFASFTMTDGTTIKLPACVVDNQVIALMFPVILVLLAVVLFFFRRRIKSK